MSDDSKNLNTSVLKDHLAKESPFFQDLISGREAVWINPGWQPFSSVRDRLGLGEAEIRDASERLLRFAPLIRTLFPETEDRSGLIESDLKEIPGMKRVLAREGGPDDGSRLFLKCDNDLPIAGSVKARGGIYEVLKHAETLAFDSGLLSGPEDDYRKLASEKARSFFSRHNVQVGSTGNLGLSIGIMSAALGFRAIVHMSSDAKQWKKDLLRAHGVQVIEYDGDYGKAVAEGRKLAAGDPAAYFVDDENSKDLFLGYATAAERLRKQLTGEGILTDETHPLFVYVPCGVGGAPGGLTFGLKHVFGDHVHVFFAEPTMAPAMLAGLSTGLHHDVSVQDLGLSGVTEADGLAVSRPSGFVGKLIAPLVSGEMTVKDERLLEFIKVLFTSEGLFIEPSAAAGFRCVSSFQSGEVQAYLTRHGLTNLTDRAAHVVWATGGRLVPAAVRKKLLS